MRTRKSYLDLVSERMGDVWITPERLRFGASALLQDILAIYTP